MTARRNAAPSRHRNWPIALAGAAALATVLALSGCAVRPPAGVQAVENFDLQRYSGRWLELARIDHRFERGLVQTSAQYSRNADGTVQVINRGYDPRKKEWRESVGKARFVGAPTTAALKVSFFGPFYGGYNVVALDPNYQWAMVVGSDLDYFWILSRTPSLPPGVRNRLLAKARALGVDIDKVLWVDQGKDGS
ncbi:MAG: lipocalin family protein [Burkholderiaceae bacterium]|nr:lipocalin family protein [Burkholderiaceae bacterium]MCO5103885.1 lipocalin family protein [Burkholderiaceae bacterium]